MKRGIFVIALALLFGNFSMVSGMAVGPEDLASVQEAQGPQLVDEAVRITSVGGQIRVDEAPAGADVSTMGGEINIRSAAKFVKAKTMGGRIQIGAIDGWVQATTMSGDVTVTMVGDPGQGKRDVNIVSYKGEITLTVPAALSMDVDIELAYTKNSQQNFRVVSDFDLQQRVSGGWVYDEGTPRKYIYGTGRLAGGQNKIKIKTVNGNVYLKRG